MEELFNNDTIIIGSIIVNVILIIFCIVNYIKLSKVKKEYKSFMKKLGKGDNIDEMLKEYITNVEKVSEQNEELKAKYEKIEEEKTKCIQKVGMVRYSAFKNVGSDLSFALAMLDEKNNGVLLNGIYSTESSNIYAKPVENGITNYTITEEEKEAINKAITAK